MSSHTTVTGQTSGQEGSLSGRLRARLRTFEPMYLAALGLLSLPGYLHSSLAFLQIFGIFFLFFLWPFVAPVIHAVLGWRSEENRAEPTDWLEMGGWRTYAVSILMLPVTFLNPLMLAQDVLQWCGSLFTLVRYRGNVPDPASYEQEVSYRLPFEDTWTVVNGSSKREYSHSWFPINQRYAYDFVITDDEGRTSPADSDNRLESYYCYDEPVLAPADGIVVEIKDSDPESSRAGGFSHPLKRDIRGNYVVIKHADGEYSNLIHLTPGSVTVEPGERVERGQEIGRCGHAGNSTEPHLHFQIQDHPNFALAASLPVQFDAVVTESPGEFSHETALGSDAEDGEMAGADSIETDSDDSTDSDVRDSTETDLGDSTETAVRDSTETDLGDSTETDVGDSTETDTAETPSRSFVHAGQRVTHTPESPPVNENKPDPANEDDSHRNSQHRTDRPRGEEQTETDSDLTRKGTIALQRATFGLCVGGMVVFLASVFLPWVSTPFALAGATLVALCYRTGLGYLGTDRTIRAGSAGIVAGLGIGTVAVALVKTGTIFVPGALALDTVLVLWGVATYVVATVYDTRQLRYQTNGIELS